jgi:hypothetical protein
VPNQNDAQQAALLQAVERGDHEAVFALSERLGLNPANKEYQLDDIAAMSDRRGYFERIGSEFEGSAVAEQPLAERLENAVYAAYYGDPNSRIDGIEAGVLSATGLGQSLADGIEALGQDPFSIIRDPVTLGYDQIQTAFYYTTGGLLGDPNSVLRNQGRTESFYDFVDAAKASINDPEQAGYLFGGALLGLRRGGLPGAPNTELAFSRFDFPGSNLLTKGERVELSSVYTTRVEVSGGRSFNKHDNFLFPAESCATTATCIVANNLGVNTSSDRLILKLLDEGHISPQTISRDGINLGSDIYDMLPSLNLKGTIHTTHRYIPMVERSAGQAILPIKIGRDNVTGLDRFHSVVLENVSTVGKSKAYQIYDPAVGKSFVYDQSVFDQLWEPANYGALVITRNK